jgi:ABC-type uncharacterized transport system substrate-binding protein
MPSPVFVTNLEWLTDLAARSRLPAIFHLREFVDAGGLMAYGPDRSDLFRRAATYVDKILKGTNPADLPVEQPTTFELVCALKRGAKRSASRSNSERWPLPTENMFKRMYIVCPPCM